MAVTGALPRADVDAVPAATTTGASEEGASQAAEIGAGTAVDVARATTWRILDAAAVGCATTESTEADAVAESPGLVLIARTRAHFKRMPVAAFERRREAG